MPCNVKIPFTAHYFKRYSPSLFLNDGEVYLAKSELFYLEEFIVSSKTIDF